jgi:hypothetical protein
VVLGWPSAKKRGRAGAGGPQAVLTAPLVRYLTRFRMNLSRIDLPLARSVVLRLRRQVGHNYWRDRSQWWAERTEDLACLSGPEFAAKHGKTRQAAQYVRSRLFGRRRRPHFWWKAPEVQTVLFSDRPDAAIGAQLGIRAQTAAHLRCLSRKLGLVRSPSGGLKIRPDNWWKAPTVRAAMLSNKRDEEVATRFGISVERAQHLRARLRRERRTGRSADGAKRGLARARSRE